MLNVINLSFLEMEQAAHLGVRRRLKSLKDRRMPRDGVGQHLWEVDVLGAMGEMAFARAAGVYFIPTVDTFHLPDVGRVQVRTTENLRGRLIIRQNDPDGIYFLVLAAPPVFTMAGWVRAQDVRQNAYLASLDSSRPPAWAIPQDDLLPLQSLVGAELPY